MNTHTPYRPGHTGYVSEFEQFLEAYRRAHPQLNEEQLRGWYLLWDKRVDPREQQQALHDSVPLRPHGYAY